MTNRMIKRTAALIAAEEGISEILVRLTREIRQPVASINLFDYGVRQSPRYCTEIILKKGPQRVATKLPEFQAGREGADK